MVRSFSKGGLRCWLEVLLFLLVALAGAQDAPVATKVISAEGVRWDVTGGFGEKRSGVSGAKDGVQFYWHRSKIGHIARATVPVPAPGRYEVLVSLAHDPSSGRFRASAGEGEPRSIDLYQNPPDRRPESLGTLDLNAATVIVRFETLAANPKSALGWNDLGLDSFTLRWVGPSTDAPKAVPATGPIKGTDLKWATTGGVVEMQRDFVGTYGNGQFYWRGAKVGDTAQVSIDVAVAGRYDLLASLGHDLGYGRFRVFIGDRAPIILDLYDGSSERILGSLGTLDLPQGNVLVRFEVLTPDPLDTSGLNALALDYFVLKGVGGLGVGPPPIGSGMVVAPPIVVPGGLWKVEGEDLGWTVSDGVKEIASAASLSAGHEFRWHHARIGAVATTKINVPVAGRYELFANLACNAPCGSFRVTVGSGSPVDIDLYSGSFVVRHEPLGTYVFPEGPTTIRFEVLRPDPRSRNTTNALGVDSIGLQGIGLFPGAGRGDAPTLVLGNSPIVVPIGQWSALPGPPYEVEGEGLKWGVSDGVYEMQSGFSELSGRQFWWRGESLGAVATTRLTMPTAGRYLLLGYFGHAPDYGRFRVYVGNVAAGVIDLYQSNLQWRPEELGTYDLPAGEVTIRFEALSPNPRSRSTHRGSGIGMLGLDYFTVQSYTRMGNVVVVPPSSVPNSLRIEGESLVWKANGGGLNINRDFHYVSGGAFSVWRESKVGKVATTTLDIPVAGRYELTASLAHHQGGGTFRFSVANAAPFALDLYAPVSGDVPQLWRLDSLGVYDLPAGRFTIQVETLAPDSRGNRRNVLDVDYFQLVRR